MKPKDICAIGLFLLFPLQGYAQQPVGYEYWVDGDFSGRRAVSSGEGIVAMDIDACELTPGMHCFYFRVKDAQGRYTPVTTQYFYRTFSDEKEASRMVEYEYWVDGDFSGRRAVSSGEGIVAMDIDAGELTPGMHCFYFRAKDTQGRYTPVTTQYFYRTFSDEKEGNKIDKYRYWVDENYSSHKVVEISPVELLRLQNVSIDIEGYLPKVFPDTVQISVSSISNEICLRFPRKSTLYIQFGDIANRWSKVEADTFYNEGLVKREAIPLTMNKEISIIKPDSSDITALVSENVQCDSIFWKCDQPCMMAIYNPMGELLRIATPTESMTGLYVTTNIMGRYYALIYRATKEYPNDKDSLSVYYRENETSLFLPLSASDVKVYSREGKIIVENEIKGKDITVYDEKGRIVSKRVVQKVREEIELPSGIYIVKTFSTHEKVLL
ncbi:MAG TPA: T9SS type A sorting domain-containing protein [Candidatus Caccoplasma intestinavium]|uniref:T9SS type A sorting domain-containing protein n=2 Tax=Bacteroidales TaxID=171549 RepID=A0A9D1GGF9_9BACT|nr:T9SS type A sorting domain-containing protein [Candidatus Caccoplasma intestinavium]